MPREDASLPNRHRRVPSFPGRRLTTWQGNLTVFGLLVAVVLAYFFWQVRQAQSSFLAQVRANALLLAGVMQLHAHSTELSQQVVEEIVETFLGNSAKFVDYLDGVEPFAVDELTAFAAEAGLEGIRITGPGDRVTAGPEGWSATARVDCRRGAVPLRHLPERRLYYLIRPRSDGDGCITVAIPALRIEALRRQVALPSLLETLSGLGGIRYARLVPMASDRPSTPLPVQVQLLDRRDGRVAEARLFVGSGHLVVGIDADPYHRRVRRLRQEFFLFGTALALSGLLLSWLLYRLQQTYLARMREFERSLAREREDATLGRAAASIAHEIRNPLNAISMGLQRLQMEAREMGGGHRRMVETMLSAVGRTNSIIEDIRRFARPLTPRRHPVPLAALIGDQLSIYGPICRERGIRVVEDLGRASSIAAGDRAMLEEVFENLMKNAVEAQPRGGELTIAVKPFGPWVEVRMENEGLELVSADIPKMLEPYFTTKTRGTGLGLSIVRRIVHAHGGRLKVDSPRPGRMRVRVLLPRATPALQSAENFFSGRSK